MLQNRLEYGQSLEADTYENLFISFIYSYCNVHDDRLNLAGYIIMAALFYNTLKEKKII